MTQTAASSGNLKWRTAALVLICIICVPAICQDTENQTYGCSGTTSAATPQSASPEAKEGSERIFGIFPAFNVSEQINPEPLGKKQKFMLFARSSYDPVTLVTPLLKVPILQAMDHSGAYGNGLEGFGYRYGVALADGASSRFFRMFLFPAVLGEDPRYFRKSQGSFKSRLGYSMSRLVVTRKDSGRESFNWSRLLGSGAAAGLSKTYYPQSQQDAGTYFLNFGLSYAAEATSNVLKEFSPEIARKLTRKKAKANTPAASPP